MVKKSAIDILLINPSYLNQSYALNAPLGLCYMASILKQKGFKAKVLDLQVEKADIRDTLNRYMPRMVGISGTTQTRFESFKIADLVKYTIPSALTVYGGYHASATADETLKNIDSIDVIVRGYGEWIIRDLFKEFTSSGLAGLDKINGISYRKNREIRHNPSYAGERDLDQLPYKMRHFIDQTKYRFYLPFQKKLAGTLVSTRGCTMNCIFCSSSLISRGVYLARSAQNICDEIEWLKDKYGIEHFFFCDNNISHDRAYINDLCDEIIKRRLDILWESKVRVDEVDFGILKKMRLAGCYMIAFGVESASERILKLINKKIRLEQVEELFNKTYSLGILTKSFFVLGHPTETFKEAKETLDFIERHRRQISMFELYPGVTIYPGTEIESFALRKGLLPPGFSWSRHYYCRHNISLAQDPYTPVLMQPQLGFKELKRLYYLFIRRSLFKPRFLWEKIRRISSRTQLKKYFRVAMRARC